MSSLPNEKCKQDSDCISGSCVKDVCMKVGVPVKTEPTKPASTKPAPTKPAPTKPEPTIKSVYLNQMCPDNEIAYQQCYVIKSDSNKVICKCNNMSDNENEIFYPLSINGDANSFVFAYPEMGKYEYFYQKCNLIEDGNASIICNDGDGKPLQNYKFEYSNEKNEYYILNNQNQCLSNYISKLYPSGVSITSNGHNEQVNTNGTETNYNNDNLQDQIDYLISNTELYFGNTFENNNTCENGLYFINTFEKDGIIEQNLDNQPIQLLLKDNLICPSSSKVISCTYNGTTSECNCQGKNNGVDFLLHEGNSTGFVIKTVKNEYCEIDNYFNTLYCSSSVLKDNATKFVYDNSNNIIVDNGDVTGNIQCIDAVYDGSSVNLTIKQIQKEQENYDCQTSGIFVVQNLDLNKNSQSVSPFIFGEPISENKNS